MWQEYKRRFVASHVIIAIGVLIAWQVMKFPPQQLLMVVIAMEFGSLLGAWMSAGIKRDVNRADDDLPLNPG